MNLVERLADYAWIVAAQVGALRPADPTRWSGGDGAPVLLLPGVWETWHVLTPLARVLHAAGHPVHVVPGLGTNSADLDATAVRVAQRLAELDLHDAVVVAHSKGGLVAKALLARPEAARRVRGIVAIATPFEGSRYATWFPSRTIRRLSPRDPGLRALADDLDPNVRIVALRPRVDPHVPRSAGSPGLAGAVEVELPLVGHFKPLGDALLHQAVVHAVEGFAST